MRSMQQIHIKKPTNCLLKIGNWLVKTKDVQFIEDVGSNLISSLTSRAYLLKYLARSDRCFLSTEGLRII